MTSGRQGESTGASGTETAIRIVVVDGHAVWRETLIRLLEERGGFRVVGEAADGKAAAAVVRQCRPDLVLMDPDLADMDGRKATASIVEENPGVRVLGLSIRDDPWTFRSMREAGASTVVWKCGSVQEILQAVKTVAGTDSA